MSIKIATPISTLFYGEEDLIEKVTDLSDALEIRDISPDFISPLPKLYHSDLSIVEEWTDEESKKVLSVIKKSKVILISLHVASCYPRAPIKGGAFQPVGRLMSEQEMMKNTKKNVEFLKNKVKNIEIAIENNNYFPTGAYELVTETSFINKLLAANDLKLLLDLGHAKITAYYRRIVLNDYLKGFYLDRIYQIHLSGCERINDSYKDAHNELADDEWEEFKQLIDFYPNLKLVTIEYYDKLPVLIKMLIKLRNILHEKNINYSN